MRNFRKNKFKNDCLAVAFLILAVTIVFLPALSGRGALFRDDHATEQFPGVYFLSINLKRGIIPLWNPHIWCGGIPYYARYYSPLYYVFNWPFYLLADPNNLNWDFLVIYILPWWLNLVLAAIGMYILSRRLLKCGCFISCLAALAYIYSPFFMRM